jgi:hypothetical protein
MPYSIRKVPGKKCYRIKNTANKRVFSKCSSRKNAIKQLRLLRAIQYNKTFKLLPKEQRPGYIRAMKNKRKTIKQRV